MMLSLKVDTKIQLLRGPRTILLPAIVSDEKAPQQISIARGVRRVSFEALLMLVFIVIAGLVLMIFSFRSTAFDI